MFVSTKFKLGFENREEKERVLSLIRLQSSAIRVIYNKLVALALPLLKKSFTRDLAKAGKKVSSLIRWGNVPIKGFLKQPHILC